VKLVQRTDPSCFLQQLNFIHGSIEPLIEEDKNMNICALLTLIFDAFFFCRAYEHIVLVHYRDIEVSQEHGGLYLLYLTKANLYEITFPFGLNSELTFMMKS